MSHTMKDNRRGLYRTKARPKSRGVRDRDRDGYSASAAQLAGRPRGVSILRARTMSDWEESEEPSTVPVPVRGEILGSMKDEQHLPRLFSLMERTKDDQIPS